MHNYGKIPEEEIKALKEIHSGPLFKYKCGSKDGPEVAYRVMDQDLRRTIQTMVKNAELREESLPVEEVNEKIFDYCVLWPRFTIEDKLNFPIGAIPQIAKVVQEKSGYIDIDVLGRAYGPDIWSFMIKDGDYWEDITDAEIENLKKDSSFQLYKVRVGKWIFVIRPMTRSDINHASASTDDILTLVRSVTMWPKEVNWEQVPAGIVEQLGRTINRLSGWDAEAISEAL